LETNKMKTARVLGLLAALAVLMAPSAARAQTFFSTRPSERGGGGPSREPGPPTQPPMPGQPPAPVVAAPKPKFQHFYFGFFGSKWSTADSIIRPAGNLTTKADAGFLASTEIFISPRWSVGGYWNHFNGQTRVIPPGAAGFERVGTDTIDVMEGHLAYYLGPKFGGFSLQAGAGGSRDRTVFDFARQPTQTFHARKISFWVNNAAKVGKISNHDVDLFGGIGARSSELVGTGAKFHLQLLVGTSVHLSQHLTGSVSVWTSDVDAKPETRVNAGISASL
jgi:hypothetical protein